MNKKLERIVFYFLSFTWGILWTLIGALIFLGIYLIFHKDLELSIVEGRVCGKFRTKNLFNVSLGLFYVVSARSSIRTQIHELGHTVQNIIFGPLFIPLIAIPSGIRAGLWDWISIRYKRKHGRFPNYYSIWFEHQANVLGDMYFSHLDNNS